MSKIESISREDFAWLAGFIDGEGCFYLGFNTAYDRGTPRKTMRTLILVSNTMVEPMIKISEIFCNAEIGFTTLLTQNNKNNPKWSDALQIKICGQGKVRKLCNLILPYLVCKKEQANQMLYALDYRKKLAEKNGGNNKNSFLINDPILQKMSERMKELNSFRSNLIGYSRQASNLIRCKKPSTTERLTALNEEDCLNLLNVDVTVCSA